MMSLWNIMLTSFAALTCMCSQRCHAQKQKDGVQKSYAAIGQHWIFRSEMSTLGIQYGTG